MFSRYLCVPDSLTNAKDFVFLTKGPLVFRDNINKIEIHRKWTSNFERMASSFVFIVGSNSVLAKSAATNLEPSVIMENKCFAANF